jgi:large subunit ribosomal protein L22
MTNTSATLSNYRQSPRKVRLVADLIRGKRVSVALAALAHLPKRASEPLIKLLHSALANARAKGIDTETLIVSRIEVNQGVVFRRFMPRARGKASPIRKKSSHISLKLAPAPEKKAKNK